MPFYQSQIDTLEHLQYVASTVSGFNQDRFLAALMGKKNITNEQLERMRLQISNVSNRLEEEYVILEEFGKTFNQRFTTHHNNCFSSAMTLLKKIRAGLTTMVRVYRDFAPNNYAAMQSANKNVKHLDLYSRSAMAGSMYAKPLFDVSAFSPEVRKLFDTMMHFMNIMGNSFRLCEDILEEEQHIREDAYECHKLYTQFKDEHRRLIKDMINSINLASHDFLEENNPAIYLHNHAENEMIFSQKGFHYLSISATTALASKEIVEEALRGEFTKEELLLFREDRQKIHRVRYIISHFDDYLPEGFRRKIIPAVYVACMMWWCQPSEDKGFVLYFKTTYEKAGGLHKPPSNPAVNQNKRQDWKKDIVFNDLIYQWENVEIA